MGRGLDTFLPPMGKQSGFVCKMGKQLLGVQAHSRQNPFHLEAAAFGRPILTEAQDLGVWFGLGSWKMQGSLSLLLWRSRAASGPCSLPALPFATQPPVYLSRWRHLPLRPGTLIRTGLL